MKRNIIIAICLTLSLLPSLSSARVTTPSLSGRAGGESRGGESSFKVSVTNPSAVARRDVPVVIDLHKALPQVVTILSAEVIAPSQTGRSGGGSTRGELIPSQLDDLDGDLLPDELCFVCNLPARATVTFKVVCSAVSPQRTFPARTAAFMKVWDRKYRYPYINSIEYQGRNEPLATYDAIYGHGAQWESELVGFRVYMDHRQSIDIYGKPTPQLILDKTNFYSTREDIAEGRGCDILFAGPSVGAGSFRGYLNNQPTYVDEVEARGQRVIASGPVRAIVEVTDRNWNYDGRRLQMRQRYIIYAGHRDVQVDIQLTGPDVDRLTFCTGVQKLEMENEGLMNFTDGLVGSWGKNVPDKAAEDLVEGVGLGVSVATDYLVMKREDDYNYLTILHPVNGHIRYHLAICALMEKDGFKDAKSWFNWLQQWQSELDHPCTIKVKR